jgi:pimeloyl-ACP methyl ester carboxylesterase
VTTFVLLRGLVRESGHWGDVGQRLQAALGDRADVIALDLPGNGVRHGETSPATVRGLLAACRAELRQRGVAPPLVLVAMSLGAMVAVQWCEQAPQELAGCVLVNTSLRGISPFWQRLRPANWPLLLRLLAPGVAPLERERLVLAMTSSDPARHAAVAQRWAALAGNHPVRRGNALRQLAAAMRYTAPAPGGVPTLVLASAADRLVDPRCSQELARRWQLPIALHPGAGHDLPLDDPQWFVTTVAGWWNASPRRHGTATGSP